MSDKSVKPSWLTFDSKIIRVKKPKGLFILRKDLNIVNLIRKSRKSDIGISPSSTIVSNPIYNTYNSRNLLTRSFSKPILINTRSNISKEAKENIELPKLVIFNKSNSNSASNTARSTVIESFRGSTRNIRKNERDI